MSSGVIFDCSLKGKVTLDLVKDTASELNCSIDDIFNDVAIEIAIRFQSGKLSYDDADFAINDVWSVMVDSISEGAHSDMLPHPAYSIYDAFDQGEYDHKDGCNSVDKYTRPLLLKAFKDT
jgi:hypothetical protein